MLGILVPIAIGVSITMSTATAALGVQKTSAGGSNNWFDTNSWNPPGVPAAGNDAVVNSGMLDLSGGHVLLDSLRH